MYFRDEDHCETTVRYRVAVEHRQEWDAIVDALDALCADPEYSWWRGEERENLSDVLLTAMADVVYANSDEEPVGHYREGDNEAYDRKRDYMGAFDGMFAGSMSALASI